MSRLALIALACLVVAPASAAPRPRGDAPETAAGDRDQIVCKRFPKTGTLAGSYRTCKAKWEWERERQNLRQFNVANSCRTAGEGAGCE
ncbi:MAG: hypothetical protein ACJ8ER_00040 [Allosphingosinicella sp.]